MTTTTLTADQSEDAVEASVAAAGPRESDFLIQIEDEYQYVEWRGDQHVHPWQVKRGFLGTLPVAHASGATVTVDPAIGGGGGGVSVDNGVDAPANVTTIVALGAVIAGSQATLLSARLIGPFAIDWTQEAALTDPGMELEALPSGCVVVRAWAEVGVRWDGAGSPGNFDYHLYIGVGVAAVGFVTATQYADWISHEASASPGTIAESSPATAFSGSVVRTTNGSQHLMASFQNFAGPLSAGTANIYALIVTAS